MSPAQSNGFTRSAIATMAMCGLPQWARTLTGRRPVWKGRKKTEETRLWLLAIYSPGRLADFHVAAICAVRQWPVRCDLDQHLVGDVEIGRRLSGVTERVPNQMQQGTQGFERTVHARRHVD
jgi:hypothetical protein